MTCCGSRSRRRSKNKAGEIVGPWAQWPERMEQKSALHRLRKRIAILGAEDVVQRVAGGRGTGLRTRDGLGGSRACARCGGACTEAPRGLQAVVGPPRRPRVSRSPSRRMTTRGYHQDAGEIF